MKNTDHPPYLEFIKKIWRGCVGIQCPQGTLWERIKYFIKFYETFFFGWQYPTIHKKPVHALNDMGGRGIFDWTL